MNPAQSPPHDTRTGQARRWRLWVLLCLLVALMLGALVFLAREYEAARSLEALEQDAATLGSDIRSSLVRNVQTLQSLHSVAPTADSWTGPAAELLVQHRELVRLEWRDHNLQLLALRTSPYQPNLFHFLPREQALPEVRQACDVASRTSAPGAPGWPSLPLLPSKPCPAEP